jgi:hypothetical protein
MAGITDHCCRVVDGTRAGDSLRRVDPRARATTTPRQETTTPSGGGMTAGTMVAFFFFESSMGSQGFLEKRGAGRTTRSPRRAKGGWLGGGGGLCGPGALQLSEPTPFSRREPLGLRLPLGSKHHWALRKKGGIQMSTFLGDPKGPRRRSNNRRQGGMLTRWMWTGLGTCQPVSVVLFVSATKHPRNRGPRACLRPAKKAEGKSLRQSTAETPSARKRMRPASFLPLQVCAGPAILAPSRPAMWFLETKPSQTSEFLSSCVMLNPARSGGTPRPRRALARRGMAQRHSAGRWWMDGFAASMTTTSRLGLRRGRPKTTEIR